MQIYNNPQIPTQTNPPAFKAIKSVKLEGLYKKFPEQGKELVSVFGENPVAMEFCKKYDVDIVFNAIKDLQNTVSNNLHIFFNNPSKRKFLGLFGNTRDNISISSYGNQINIEESLKASCKELKKFMSKETSGIVNSGMLDSHIQLKEKEIEEVLQEKLTKQSQKYDMKAAKYSARFKHKEDKASLENSIDELINKSK